MAADELLARMVAQIRPSNTGPPERRMPQSASEGTIKARAPNAHAAIAATTVGSTAARWPPFQASSDANNAGTLMPTTGLRPIVPDEQRATRIATTMPVTASAIVPMIMAAG